jgi:hypothetical protein
LIERETQALYREVKRIAQPSCERGRQRRLADALVQEVNKIPLPDAILHPK